MSVTTSNTNLKVNRMFKIASLLVFLLAGESLALTVLQGNPEDDNHQFDPPQLDEGENGLVSHDDGSGCGDFLDNGMGNAEAEDCYKQMGGRPAPLSTAAKTAMEQDLKDASLGQPAGSVTSGAKDLHLKQELGKPKQHKAFNPFQPPSKKTIQQGKKVKRAYDDITEIKNSIKNIDGLSDHDLDKQHDALIHHKVKNSAGVYVKKGQKGSKKKSKRSLKVGDEEEELLRSTHYKPGEIEPGNMQPGAPNPMETMEDMPGMGAGEANGVVESNEEVKIEE